MADRSIKTVHCTGFPPIASAGARVLVLGSMPSVASLAREQYYGHPQNAFWPIMGRLFGAGPELPYEARKIILIKRRVAVWDVLQSCRRAGSLDTAIERDTETPNDFATFFGEHRQVTAVFFNGQKAETAFRCHVFHTLDPLRRELQFVRLPSTSPAHAGRSFKEKLQAWRSVAVALTKSTA
jgi:hypoxanthine-DNA glycosylase